MEFGDERLPPRFWNKVRIDASGCWLWLGAVKCKSESDKRYGVYTHEGKPTPLNWAIGRALFPGYDEEKYRPVNTCENENVCVEPTHIVLRDRSACKNGHIDPPRKNRNCVLCKREREAERPPRLESRSGTRKFVRKPVAIGRTVFGDRPPGYLWRPTGWPREVLGGKLSA